MVLYLEVMWKIIAISSLFGIFISLNSFCPFSSPNWFAAIGGTALYVTLLLMFHFTTDTRIYKEEEPPLPATRAGYSVILMTAMLYFPYYYSALDFLIYLCSMFAFGISIFQLNSPMDTTHVSATLFFGFFAAYIGYGFNQNFPNVERSFWFVFVFSNLFIRLMFPLNGLYN
ncbi:unnamed protein product [Microthlaspi erraticum]|uniref:Uncharacterized protein n=1 Tax=Microthlaspi erraticum TaxID=1685480 RepID=A0A6D2JSU2_9BRAS|nr:unnamed protein product [Microthlaspi erraticum]